ncbi:hypothetical protein BJ878DRAFT_479496 [Calycina marina]|uniref:HNH nuclease domain-containing protein n=1 Tax=Calycina marina TaxID=1763456 RepID=A0A9P8CH71_9HELO|nr:hypothetical protein BJ878DRAFT_479496 [Calycina marina]
MKEEIEIGTVAAMACRFMHDRHAGRYLGWRRVTILVNARFHGSNTENSLGASFSGSKRKRAIVDDGSDRARSRTRVSSTSDFNKNTKAQVREQYNNKCWHCGASPADVCHVIGSRDHNFHEARTHGLIDFHEKQYPQNAIALCDHQIHQGIEGAEMGGLYARIVLNDFLPQYPGSAPFQPGLSEYGATKSWTGSPMASLRRAVLMLRRLNLHGIPWETRNALRQLQDAYSEELDLDSSDTSSQGSIELSTSEEDKLEEGNGERFEDKTTEPRARSQQDGAEQSSACGKREQDFEEHVANENK